MISPAATASSERQERELADDERDDHRDHRDAAVVDLRHHRRQVAVAAQLRREVGFRGLAFVSLRSTIGSGWLPGALTAAKALLAAIAGALRLPGAAGTAGEGRAPAGAVSRTGGRTPS